MATVYPNGRNRGIYNIINTNTSQEIATSPPFENGERLQNMKRFA